ncbi:MAG TPA: tRNA uridine-5-carboxymethylaminomethyl(34) synthesis enzyme MnmG, partial [Dehalococcoidia bacterium]|nr:tRNA uridine-5-carboxymethylaminomethyl(34) synthesis enzyme MnmG [Dehalococcoidia bacterium]
YRLFTSRAEYRLLLRQDNADLRLSRLGHDLGLIAPDRARRVEQKRAAVAREIERLHSRFLSYSPEAERAYERLGLGGLRQGLSAADLLCRPNVRYATLLALGLGDATLAPDAVDQVEIETKYAGYIERQRHEVERVQRMEDRRLPDGMDFTALRGLRTEAREKLLRFRPATVGQASRIAGVTPADVAVLLVHLERQREPA